jgi:hypothetical protein
MDTIQVGEAVEPESGPRLPSASLRSELPNSDLEPTVHSIVVIYHSQYCLTKDWWFYGFCLISPQIVLPKHLL